MYRRMLFAAAEDEASRGALPFVVAWALLWSASVRVLHVHRVGRDAAARANGRVVKGAVNELLAAGIAADGEVRLARGGENVADVIVRAAIGAEADLVVVGSRGRSDLGGLFLGSVSHRVAAGLQVPVLVLRASPEAAVPPRRILAAVGGPERSEEAVAEAGGIAGRVGGEVLVLHVREGIAAAGSPFLEAEEEASTTVAGLVEGLAERGVRAAGEVVEGHAGAAAVIASVAEQWEADLVVVASRRPSDLGGLLLGSVGHQLVHRLRRPVLFARRVRQRYEVH